MRITTVGLDADDTLWHNETIFRLTQDRLREMMADFADHAATNAKLAEVEKRNLRLYGYGVKGFTLSVIETAMELTGGNPPGRLIADILAAGREMLAHPVEPLPGVDQALADLAEAGYRLVLITKGDLLHQEQKLAASGLGDLFAAVEIVSEKDASTYSRVFDRYGTGAAEAVMCGNSMRSDILPALEAGCWGAYIPYHITWEHEVAEPPGDHPRFVELSSISELAAWVGSL
ncbi:MAG: HAD family hydrolase [Alphaproteobacteria bacterium]|nr:HAD family hydrolase [Alphaproteobacteria bacterium]MBU1513491.1 HAD family hydrolase [Alphaproteobacteria bacterium]MBU2096483.1 HAD family hydrolase [Alphaproteobacteria bacterium]MBU2149825.1 HAD family hydrolase [Alphaproteobacteria bacterium]MBU2305200.1 HAD family hydrolase [Alphaproteobacteria bacterium]